MHVSAINEVRENQNNTFLAFAEVNRYHDSVTKKPSVRLCKNVCNCVSACVCSYQAHQIVKANEPHLCSDI